MLRLGLDYLFNKHCLKDRITSFFAMHRFNDVTFYAEILLRPEILAQKVFYALQTQELLT